MRIRFHIRMAVISKLSRRCLVLAALMLFATLICLGKPLDLTQFFPTSFAEFFLWICALPALTIFAGLGAIVDLNQFALFRFLSSDSMQMAAIGSLALLSLLVYWAFARYVVLKHWGTEWVKAATTIVQCFILWGTVQLACVFVSYAWIAGGFKLGNSRPHEDSVKQIQTIVPEEINAVEQSA